MAAAAQQGSAGAPPSRWFRWGVLAPCAVAIALCHHFWTVEFFSVARPEYQAYTNGSALLALAFLLLPWRRPALKWSPALLLSGGALLAQASTAIGLARAYGATYLGGVALAAGASAAVAWWGGGTRLQRAGSAALLFALAVVIGHPSLIHRRTFRLPDAAAVAALPLDDRLTPLALFAARDDIAGVPVVALGDPRELLPDAAGRVDVVYGGDSGDSGGGQGLAALSPDGSARVTTIAERGLAVDATGDTLFAVSAGLTDLIRVEREALAVAERLPLPFERAERVVLDERTGRLLLFSEAARLLVVEAATFEVVRELALPGMAAKDLRRAGDAWVLRSYDGWLVRIDPASLAFTTRKLPMWHPGMGLAVSSDGGEIYAPTMNGTGILVLDATTLETKRRLAGPWTIRRLAVVDALDLLVGGDFFRGTVYVIDATTGETLAEIPAGWAARPVVHDPHGDRVLVGSNFGVFALSLDPWADRRSP